MTNQQPAPQLIVELSANLFPDGAKYKVGAADQFYMFEFELVNNSTDQTYRIETWGTPLMAEEYFQPLLEVVYNPNDPNTRKVLQGDYFRIKTRKAEKTDYITLAPGERSESFGFRVIDIFRIEKAGPYSVAMTCHFPSIEAAGPANPSSFGAPITNFVATSSTLFLQMNVTGTPTTVQVFDQLSTPPAAGGMAPKNTQGSAVKPPVFTAPSTDPKRQDIITQAHYAAYDMVRTAVRELTDGPSQFTKDNLTTWFGTHTNPKALEAILNSYRKIVSFMETENVIYDFSHPTTANSDNDAFVTGIGGTWNKTVYVAAGFWEYNPNMVGPDSRAGTMVHELAHGVDMAQDFAEAWYGSGPTKRLAKLNPSASIMHADAIGRFAEVLNPLVGNWSDENGKKYRIFMNSKGGGSASVSELTANGEKQLWTGVNIFGELAGKYCYLYCYVTPGPDSSHGGNGYLQPDLDTIYMYSDGHDTHTFRRTP